jgi:acetyltransferase
MADYPAHLEREHVLADGRRVTIRPIRPADECLQHAFFDGLSPESRHKRFMKNAAALNEQLIHFFTHIDYDRHMAFVGEHAGRLVGEARYVANPGGRSCEFGLVVAEAWRRQGIARLLMEALMEAARAHGFERIEGLVLRTNQPMLRFIATLGFDAAPDPYEPALIRVVRKLPASP